MNSAKVCTNIFIAITFIGCLTLPDKVYADTYFVSPGGNNNNNGKSFNLPVCSINQALTVAAAGDTIYLLPGTYNELVRFQNKKGLTENAICLLGYSTNRNNYPVINGGAEKPLLDGSNDWVHMENSCWIEISRIKFENGWTNPIKIFNSSYLSFDNCIFTGGKRVINVSGVLSHHILVENCYWDQGGDQLWKIEKDSKGFDAWLSMHHLSMGYFNGSLIDFNRTGGSIVIRNNTIVNAYNAIRFRGEKGYDANIEIYDNHISNVRDNDFEPEYYTYNLFIYNNISHNIHRTLSVDNVEGGNIYYFGNVITSDSDQWTKNVCSSVGKIYGTSRNLSLPLYVFNNSIYTWGIAYKMDAGKAVWLKHFNNAFYFCSANGFILNKWDNTNEFNYDISNKAWPENIKNNHQESDGKVSDIKFVDPVNGNLTLRSGSPGIDAGKIISIKELDWSQSYEGNAPDIGAYENGKLVKGPAFRFRNPPDGNIEYKEKPRIVRNYYENNKLILYFSGKIDTASVNKNSVFLFKGNTKLSVTSVSFPVNPYQMVIETAAIPPEGLMTISFSKMPLGINGESVTFWASTINAHENILSGIF